MPLNALRALAEALRDFVAENRHVAIDEALLAVARQQKVSLSRMQYALTYAESEGWLAEDAEQLELVAR